jgi:hypothetical protein
MGAGRSASRAAASARPALLAHGAFAFWSALAPEAALAALPGAMLLALALHVLVSVNVLRLVLLGPHAVPPLGLSPWGRRQWRFLAALGLQALAMTFAMLAFAPLAFLGVPGLAICAAAGVFAAGRASLLLPEAALDRPFDGRVLWQRGQGASLALAFIVLVPVVLQALLLGPLGGDGELGPLARPHGAGPGRLGLDHGHLGPGGQHPRTKGARGPNRRPGGAPAPRGDPRCRCWDSSYYASRDPGDPSPGAGGGRGPLCRGPWTSSRGASALGGSQLGLRF